MALFGTYWNNVARAAAANDAVKVRELVGEQSPNQVDDEGRTGLQIAATNGNLQIAAILIKAGASLDQKDKLGNTALHLAADRNQVEMAQLLIDVGAALDADNRNGMTPLMLAASRGNAAIVQALLAKGANARKTDFTGRDALSWANDSRRPAVVQLLQRAAVKALRLRCPSRRPSLDEIRALLAHLPGPDLEAGTAAATRERQLTKPAGALGRLEELAAWLATWQARHPPRLRPPAHRRVRRAITGSRRAASRPTRAAVTAQMVQNFIAGGAAVNQLCRTVDADLRVYEMNLDTPTADIVEAPAMSEEECARAIAYGMMAVEPGIDALAVGEMGIANTTVAAALCMGLFGGDAADVDRARAPGSSAPRSNRSARSSPRRSRGTGRRRRSRSRLLRRLGGLEFAAMAGAILAARMGRVPVVLDGFSAGAAAAVLYAADPRAIDHCVAGHVSAEPGHRLLLERLGKRPLLDLGMRLGEASGATLPCSC